VTDEPLLLAVPNVSEGRDATVVEQLARAFAPLALLDVHADADHNRSVITLAGRQGEVAEALVAGARAAAAKVDLRRHEGVHPRVGALDVAPVVYVEESDRGAACAAALTAAALIADAVELPVFLYGQLATSPEHRERADLRAGGPGGLAGRIERGELRPDFGPARTHPSAGAVLVTARPPLVAFNVTLAGADLELARAIAAELRESGGGLPGVRAVGLFLRSRDRAQISCNVHDSRAVPLRLIVERVRERADIGDAELVGLAPSAALEGFPEDVPLRGFSPDQHLIENALRSLA
jgi:glutamate formiminotransferase / 5-formyltetrahydrofolate cyclo-ligase